MGVESISLLVFTSLLINGLLFWILSRRVTCDLHLQFELERKWIGQESMHEVLFMRHAYLNNKIKRSEQITLQLRVPEQLNYGDRLCVKGVGHQILDNDVNGDVYVLLIEPRSSKSTDPVE